MGYDGMKKWILLFLAALLLTACAYEKENKKSNGVMSIDQ